MEQLQQITIIVRLKLSYSEDKTLGYLCRQCHKDDNTFYPSLSENRWCIIHHNNSKKCGYSSSEVDDAPMFLNHVLSVIKVVMVVKAQLLAPAVIITMLKMYMTLLGEHFEKYR